MIAIVKECKIFSTATKIRTQKFDRELNKLTLLSYQGCNAIGLKPLDLKFCYHCEASFAEAIC
jgi:hypothetical protein